MIRAASKARVTVLGPNLQSFVRWTCKNVTKKSHIWEVYEKTWF